MVDTDPDDPRHSDPSVSCALEVGRARAVFGAGRLEDLPSEVRHLGLTRLLAIGTPRFDLPFGLPIAGSIEKVRSHVPIELVRSGRARAAELSADGLLAVGGGSAIGLAKAVALTSGLPIVAVPTTYAGSEMTPIWGITENGHKTTGSEFAVLPRLVIYDPELQASLPPAISAASGVNALAHAVEALWAPGANPIANAVSEEAIRVLPAALTRIVASPEDAAARADALRGAWLAGTALASAGTAIHHALCHLFGGTFGLPHAEVHAILLPHVSALILPGASDARIRLGRAMGAADPALELGRLTSALELPRTLAELGMKPVQLSRAIELGVAKNLAAPLAIDRDVLTELLRSAYHG